MASSVFSRVPSSLKTILKYGSVAFAGFYGGVAGLLTYHYTTKSTADFVTTYNTANTGRIDVDVSEATIDQKEQWDFAFCKNARYVYKENDVWSLKSSWHNPKKDKTVSLKYKHGELERLFGKERK